MPSYPKWLYHHSKPATVVADEAAHKALGTGWVESPALLRGPEGIDRAVIAEIDAAKPKKGK